MLHFTELAILRITKRVKIEPITRNIIVLTIFVNILTGTKMFPEISENKIMKCVEIDETNMNKFYSKLLTFSLSRKIKLLCLFVLSVIKHYAYNIYAYESCVNFSQSNES